MTRRTKSEMEQLRAAILGVCAEDHPMTVRQVFYRLVSMGAVGKTEGEYKGTVVRLLGEMRESGDLPWSWIVDNTRWMRKPRTFDNLEDALQDTAAFYRRSLWTDLDEYVEIWLEKEALAGVVHPITQKWDVPLMVTRGYPSKSYLYSAAETIAGHEKRAVIYYFGDHDPSGVDIPRATEDALRRYLRTIQGPKGCRYRDLFPGAEGELYAQLMGSEYVFEQDDDDPLATITFERAAVTPDQITAMNLPTRPTKRTDTRARSFRGESVELDAIPPDKLREMVEECISNHINETELAVLLRAEESERELLEKLAETGIDGLST